MLQKGIVLRVNTQPLIKRDVHQLGGTFPVATTRIEAGALGNEPVGARIGGLQLLRSEGCLTQVLARHQVGVGVVVDDGGVLVRTRDAVDAKAPVSSLREEAQVTPQARVSISISAPHSSMKVWSPPICTYLTIP